jgi:hypothetical protein
VSNNVEAGISEMKSRMSSISAMVPHLATKADVLQLRTAVIELQGYMSARFGPPEAELRALKTRLIKWAVTLYLVVAGLVFIAAKLVH